MPRIIVTTDLSQVPDDALVLLDEHVQSVHVSTSHAAAQLVERLVWAISDAEDVEGTTAGRQPVSVRASADPPPQRHSPVPAFT
jgi:hypothetical protein